MAKGLSPGVLLGRRYRLQTKLGAGGFGTVWLATDARTGRQVAIKVLHTTVPGISSAAFAKIQRRFMDEVAILERLEHPNIVRSIDRFVDEDYSCVVTDFIRGTTLRAAALARARAGGELQLDEVWIVLEAIAAALTHAHARGVVHRDLKPQNIMLLEEASRFEIKVLDFGIARLLRADEDADSTTVGRVLGTLLYMAPEQFATPKVGAAADQFALASIAFELLTLRRAWAYDKREIPMHIAVPLAKNERNGYATLVARVAGGARPSACTFRRGLPTAIDEALHRAWRPRPDERFASVADFAQALRDALSMVVDEETLVAGTASALTLVPVEPRRATSPEDPASNVNRRTDARSAELSRPTSPPTSGGARSSRLVGPLVGAVAGALATAVGFQLVRLSATASTAQAVDRVVMVAVPPKALAGGPSGIPAGTEAPAKADVGSDTAASDAGMTSSLVHDSRPRPVGSRESAARLAFAHRRAVTSSVGSSVGLPSARVSHAGPGTTPAPPEDEVMRLLALLHAGEPVSQLVGPTRKLAQARAAPPAVIALVDQAQLGADAAALEAALMRLR